MTKYEAETPLAFSIVVHGHLGQLEALMATIFRPHNSYCLYVDAKASKKFHRSVEQMVKNYKTTFPEVNISSSFFKLITTMLRI